jgi:hypothetical protein
LRRRISVGREGYGVARAAIAERVSDELSGRDELRGVLV